MRGIITPYPTQKVSDGDAPLRHSRRNIGGKNNTTMETFETVALNNSNFPKNLFTVSLSNKKVVEADPEKGLDGFYYYWVTFKPKTDAVQQVIAMTGEKFCKLLGEDADDAKLVKVLKDSMGQFEIVHVYAEDDNGEEKPLFNKNGKPVLRIQKAAHSAELDW